MDGYVSSLASNPSQDPLKEYDSALNYSLKSAADLA